MKIRRIILFVIGLGSILVSLGGFLYNGVFIASIALSGDISHKVNAPYFYPAFYTMSVICIICYAILLFCGIGFIRNKEYVLPIFVITLIFEVIYFISIQSFCRYLPDIGNSIDAARGVANGGLLFQGMMLFPLWAPFLAIWATKGAKEEI